MKALLPTGSSLDDAERYANGLLAGRRVRLRPVSDDDLAALAAAWADPGLAVHQTATVLPRPQAETSELLRAWTRNERVSEGAAFAVETLDGELAGWVSLFGMQWPHRVADLGVQLLAERVGEGLGTEAVELMVRYGFQELGLHRIQLAAYAYNTRGIAVYEKVGFVREGARRRSTFRGGAWHDEVLMGLLADEWEPRA